MMGENLLRQYKSDLAENIWYTHGYKFVKCHMSFDIIIAKLSQSDKLIGKP